MGKMNFIAMDGRNQNQISKKKIKTIIKFYAHENDLHR